MPSITLINSCVKVPALFVQDVENVECSKLGLSKIFLFPDSLKYLLVPVSVKRLFGNCISSEITDTLFCALPEMLLLTNVGAAAPLV